MCFRCDLKSRLLTGAAANGLRLDAEECAVLSQLCGTDIWRSMGDLAEMTLHCVNEKTSDATRHEIVDRLLFQLCNDAKGNRQTSKMNPALFRLVFAGLATWMLRELGEGERLVEAFR